jgi:hypothetical protein
VEKRIGTDKKKIERSVSVGDVTGFLASFMKKKIRSYFLVFVTLLPQ